MSRYRSKYRTFQKFTYRMVNGGVSISMFFLWLFSLIIIAAINGAIAKSKNRSVIGWVLLTIPFGLIATLVVAVMPGLPYDHY